MKVLILSCSTGEGHNSAAHALEEYFTDRGIDHQMVDTLSLVRPSISQKASDLYLFSTKTAMFKLLYDAGSLVSNSKTKSAVFFANKLYCDKLFTYIKEHQFDTIICTHLFPAEAMTALKKSGSITETCLFVMTDYTCIPFIAETRLDNYIIPHEHLIEEFAQKGIPREKLLPYGIPIKHTFFEQQPKEYARIACKKVVDKELDDQKHWWLIMSGSMGFGNIKELVSSIISTHGNEIEVLLVCGNNTKLQQTLQKEFGENNNITILGFTDKISLLMDACDVLFTKPGGLSSTEAAAKNIPMIHTAPIPGCETRNAEFFHYHGMSYSSKDIDEQIRQAMRLSTDTTYRHKMMLSQKINSHPEVCSQILKLCTEQK